MIKRYLEPYIIKDLKRKMVFLAGPRQSGKTTLAEGLFGHFQKTKNHYMNWDAPEDREKLIKHQFPPGAGLLVLDEIHKYSGWRDMVKGLFDKRRRELAILVTGSGRLDYYRYSGDSLQGRYNMYRLHPLSLAEIGGENGNDIGSLLEFGGFPEPFLMRSTAETRRFSRSYRTRLLEEDLNKLEDVKDLGLVEKLVLRLPDLVGSPLSLNSLKEDLQVSYPTLVRWMEILERLYAVFRIYPFGSPKIRAVKKEAKHYHFDWTLIEDPGSRFENLVACHLLKWCHFMQDTEGWDMELRYFRDTDKREVDFVVMQEKKPIYFIEVKSKFKEVSLALIYLKRKFPQVKAYQITLDDKSFENTDGVIVCPASEFLMRFV